LAEFGVIGVETSVTLLACPPGGLQKQKRKQMSGDVNLKYLKQQ
jgi:hypothetical protein